MLKVGLTGGIGTGKSTASNFFNELGAFVLDTDTEAKIMLSAKPESTCIPSGVKLSWNNPKKSSPISDWKLSILKLPKVSLSLVLYSLSKILLYPCSHLFLITFCFLLWIVVGNCS